jgi:hypothetical protein
MEFLSAKALTVKTGRKLRVQACMKAPVMLMENYSKLLLLSGRELMILQNSDTTRLKT